MPSRRACAGALDRGQALVPVAALERDEAGEIERAHQDRQLAQLGLIEDPHPREQPAQRREEDRRLDVAGVIDRVDGGAIAQDVLRVPDVDR